MRKIKFRAWHKDDELMLTVGDLMFDAGGISHEEERETLAEYIDVYPRYEKTTWSELKDVLLMQYTGLKDKNGVEIYEGDIVKNNDCMWSIYAKEAHYCMAKDGHQTDNDQLFVNEDQHSEVIGNIYENPELLNKE